MDLSKTIRRALALDAAAIDLLGECRCRVDNANVAI
jgi:hypothetical protein